jgi:hypothetical protein
VAYPITGRSLILFVETAIHNFDDAGKLLENRNSWGWIDAAFRGDGWDVLRGVSKANVRGVEGYRVLISLK